MNSFRHISRDGFRFLISGDADADEFQNCIPQLDTLIRSGKILKDSKTSTAALCEIPGCGFVFIKRTNQKGFRFILRYLFRSARAFRAAAIIRILSRNGIETPALTAVGEHRAFSLILQAGYLITECKQNAPEIYHIIVRMENPEQGLNELLPKASVLLAGIHKLNIVHGDYKLPNIYQLSDGTCGTWDLDGASVSGAPLSIRKRLIDLKRLLHSAESVCKLKNVPFDRDHFAEVIVHSYCSLFPDLEQVLRSALKHG